MVDLRFVAAGGPLLLWVAAVASCGEPATKKTDGAPPLYDSTENFFTGASGGSTGNGGGPDYESNNPIYRGALAQSAVVVGEHLVVMPQPRLFYGAHPSSEWAGLLVYSLTDPLAPALVGRLDVEGWPLQMAADGSALTLVLRGPRQVDEPAIPTEALSEQRTALLQIDLSDPAAQRKIAELELDDGFWQFSKSGDHDYVLSERSRVGAACEFQGETSRASYIEGLRAMSFALDPSGFSQVREVELPFDGYLAFATDSGFVAVDDAYLAAPSISAARFGAAGALTQTGSVPVAGIVQAAGEVGDLLAVVTRTPDSESRVETFSASPSELVSAGSIALPTGYDSFHLKPASIAGEAVLLGDGFVVRFEASGAPRIVALAPDARLLAAGDHVLSVRPSQSQTLTLTLFSLNADNSATTVTTAESEWPYNASNSSPWAEDDFSWDASGRLVYLYAVYDDTTASGLRSGLGVATISGDSISLASADFEATGRALVAGDAAHVIGELTMQSASVIAMTPGAVTPFYGDEQLIDELTIADRAAKLVRRGDAVFVSLDGTEFQLPHFADELVLTESYLIAAGLRQMPDCERFPDIPELDLGCQKPLSRGFSFLALDSAAPEPVTLLIDNQMDGLVLPADSEQWTTWEGLLRVGSDRLVFPVTRTIMCGSAASCAELGVPAYRSFGAPGCSEPPCDPSTQEPFELISGTGTESLLYSLDLSQPPAFGPPLVLAPGSGRQGRFAFQSAELATSLDLGAEILRSGDRLAFPTRDPVYNEEGNSVSDASGQNLVRFGLELVQSGAELVHEASLSTPGQAVAMSADGSRLLSVEPRSIDSEHIVGLLHRSEIRGAGVYIEQSVELGEGFRDGLQQGDRAFFVTGPTDYCAAEPTSDVFYTHVTGGTLTTSERLTLPFGNWGLERSAETSSPETLILNGGPLGYRGRAAINASAEALSVARYYSVK